MVLPQPRRRALRDGCLASCSEELREIVEVWRQADERNSHHVSQDRSLRVDPGAPLIRNDLKSSNSFFCVEEPTLKLFDRWTVA